MRPLKIQAKNLYWDIYEKRHFSVKMCTHFADGAQKVLINRDEMAGLFSYVEIVMRKTVIALEKGYIPYVDMTGCINPYLNKSLPEDEDVSNWWEMFFEQPVDEESSARQIINNLILNGEFTEIPHSREGVLYKKSRYFWGKVYSEYFKLNRKSTEYFTAEYNELFENGKIKVLGVLVRGTDYTGAKGHPIQPSLARIIKEVKKREKKYDKIYVASDEYENVKTFENAFSGKILVNKRKYYDHIDMTGKTINEVEFDRDNDGYLRGLEYLSSVMLLSRCHCLVGGICGGTVAAVYINNNKYEDLKLLYCGLNTS